MDDAFQRLEQELVTRPRSDAPVGLRARVLCEVGRRLHDEQRRGAWLFAASVAAVFVLWLNLSWFAARETEFFDSQTVSTVLLDDIAEQIQRLVPELSRREARRQALLMRACNEMRPSPATFPMHAVR